jgi:hypothetical protein
MTEKSNISKGRTSFDANVGGSLVTFLNRNISEYPTEAGGPKFDLVPVTKQKDIMINAARMHAQQEYDRIMELVAVLQRQANDLKKRLDITDMVHAAKYEFQLYHGQYYWLVYDSRKDCTRLVHLGPSDWTSAPPEEYQYITRIQWLGDHTWREANDES